MPCQDKPIWFKLLDPIRRRDEHVEAIGNRTEIGYNRGCMAKDVSPQKAARLEELINLRLKREGRAERVARALAALHQEEPIKLSREEWKWVTEDDDLGDPS